MDLDQSASGAGKKVGCDCLPLPSQFKPFDPLGNDPKSGQSANAPASDLPPERFHPATLGAQSCRLCRNP
jgi:hypothetical protein